MAIRCPDCGNEERDGTLYCGMCKRVFAKAPAPPLASEDWIRRDGAGGVLDDVSYRHIRTLCAAARADAEAGRLDEANRQYTQALAILPVEPALWDAGSAISAAVGENHLRAGRYEQARTHLTAAVQGHNGHRTPMFRWLLGEALVELGDIEPAIDHLTAARQVIGAERLAHRHPKYLGVADRRPSFIQLADPPRPAEPPIHDSWLHRPMLVTPPSGAGKMLFVVYATYPHVWPPIRSRYRVPQSLALDVFGRGHELFQQWIEPPVRELLERNAGARAAVEEARTAVIASGELPDAASHADYWRTLQLVSAALPDSGAAVYDAAALRWFAREQWLATFRDGAALDPRHHVRLSRRGPDILTGGMRKFARPDIVMRDVPASRDATATSVLHALCDSMIAGAPVGGGPIVIAGERFHCIPHLSDLDNPYVENVWLELHG